jgi:hypothetical protein
LNVEVCAPLERDLLLIAANMRAADRDEVWASSHVEPEQALRRSLTHSTHAWVGRVDDEPVIMFGVGMVSLLGGIGAPWLLGTDGVQRYSRTFLRLSRGWLTEMRAAYPVLVNYVDARNALSIRWLRWLGFQIGPAVAWGADHLPFHRFEMGD